ncbi:MAG: RelA/SpoT domain-containing protein [candidate division NC10 bacterium]|nr:RelA/SpoT domain-containing protein [candidate division NC10 bacterium]
MTNLSHTQIDRLGDRLREGSLTESDLRILDEYRRSFEEAYETVVRTLRDELHLEPTGRPAKSTSSLIEKLRRESIRLSQVQDIAGCRVVVADIAEQERIVASLCVVFAGASVIDRRADPSHGYRAVHVIVKTCGRLVEIQVRTLLQHLWAEFSEKLSDVVDPMIKYGGGDDETRRLLGVASEYLTRIEGSEQMIARLQEQQASDQHLQALREQTVRRKEELAQILSEMISEVET